MSDKSNQLYKRLNELSLIVSSNLVEIDDNEYIKEILPLIKNSRVSIYSGLFEDSLKYYKMHKKFPDFSYVDMHYPELLEELEGEEPAFHESFIEEYLKLLRRDVFLQEIEKAVSEEDVELIENIVSTDTLFSVDEKNLKTWEDLFNTYDKLKNLKDPLSWGVRELNEMYNGLCYGTLNILAAPPGKFKTTTLCSVAYTNFSKGKKVLYITLEDSWDVIYFNLLARQSYEEDRLLSASKMKIGRLEEEDEPALKEIIKECRNKYKDTFRVACQETWDDFSPSGLLRLLKKVYRDMNGLDLVILDHASLLKFYPIKGINDPKEVINFYIRYLTNLCISFKDKFVLLVAMQTNREGIKELESGKTGSLTNLAEANEAERSASTVTLIYSGPNQVDSNIIQFYPKKNRRGYLTAKPVISFIEPAAYFVGERAIEGDVDLDDLLDEMDNEDNTPFEETKEVERKTVKTIKKTTETKEVNNNNSSKLIKKKRIKNLNNRNAITVSK